MFLSYRLLRPRELRAKERRTIMSQPDNCLEFSAGRPRITLRYLFSLAPLPCPPHQLDDDLAHPDYNLRNCTVSVSYLFPKSLTCL